MNMRLESRAMALFSNLSEQVEDAEVKQALINCSDNLWDEAPDTVVEKGYLECVDSIASYLDVKGPELSVIYDRFEDYDENSISDKVHDSELLSTTPPNKRKRHERHESDEDADDESSVADSDISEFGSRPPKKLRLLTTCALCS